MIPIKRKVETAWGILQAYFRGWKTKRKIVVIESDDWGAIRTSLRGAYDRLVDLGYEMDKSPFNKDALETTEDLDLLFNVLESIKDQSGRSPCITANIIMANPDFDRIRQSDFQDFFYEPVDVSLSHNPIHQDVTQRWLDGMRRKIFIPQLHGLYHVCWWNWLKSLKNNSPEALLTFEMNMCGVPRAASKEGKGFYGPVYLFQHELMHYNIDIKDVIMEGAKLFEKLFGYNSLSTVAPNYGWTDKVEDIWSDNGIKYIQGSIFQNMGRNNLRRAHFLGEYNPRGCYYLVRNCEFEPATEISNCVGKCLQQIKRAFYMHKPAIICTHRFNLVGTIFPSNRDRSLGLLKKLLESIIAIWPDVVFLSSPELGYLIQNGDYHLETFNKNFITKQ